MLFISGTESVLRSQKRITARDSACTTVSGTTLDDLDMFNQQCNVGGDSQLKRLPNRSFHTESRGFSINAENA